MAPPVSKTAESRIYYDSTAEALMVSNDGYTYLPLGTGAIIGAQKDTSIATIATSRSTEIFNNQYAGSIEVDGTDWTGIVFETVGSVSRSGISHDIQLWDLAAASEIAMHSHTSTTSTAMSTPISVSGSRIVEVRQKLTGAPQAGDSGLMGIARLVLQSRSTILVDPPANGVVNQSPITVIGANYTPTADDSVLLVNALSAPVTITLPSVSTFAQYYFTIKKIDSSSNIVTIASASLVDGQASVVLSAEDQGVTVQSSGSSWFVTRDTGDLSVFGQVTATFSVNTFSVTISVADPGVSAGSRIVASVSTAPGRDADEMESAPILPSISNIVAGVGFDIVVVSLDGDADGTYLINYIRN